MSTQATNWRETDFTDREKLMLAVIGVLGLIIGGLFVFDDGYGIFLTSERHSYVTNLFTEGISVVVTVVALGLWQAERARETLKKTLVRNTKRRSNDTVLDAIDGLRENGWLTGEDGLLQGEVFFQAQMQGVVLWAANLDGANLQGANLTDAILPNGETYSDTTDMAKFTDPDHPEYAQTLEQINALRQEEGLSPW